MVQDSKTKYSVNRVLSLLLTLSIILGLISVIPIPVSSADADYTFSSGAVLLDESYSGKNVLITNGVFSVTVTGAADVNIIFDGVTMDRRYASDTNGTVPELYNVAKSLGWISGSTYYAQTCPLLITNNASATVAFRGENNFYAGPNRCTVDNGNVYKKNIGGGGFAGIQVDSGSALTIAQSGGTINAYGAFYVEGDNSENSSYGYSAPSGTTHNALSGGAGIGGGAAWNTTTCKSKNYERGTPGTITINGGNINAFGGHQAAGIGGGLNGAATSTAITINGGNVTSYGGRWAAGIGDGDSLEGDWADKYSDSYSVVVNGGVIYAVGGVACPGIGTTDEIASADYARRGVSGLEIHINGGTIRAKSGYPDKFNPAGTVGYRSSDAAAAIGAGNTTNMETNSISISSAAKVIAAGFGHYSVTENGVKYDEQPKINIDSSGYMFLGRFPELASAASRTFDFFEAQRYDTTIDGKEYQYIKYVTQPADGSSGEIYYYCAEASDKKWLLKAGNDGEIENATLVAVDSEDELRAKLEELALTIYVDDNSIHIDEALTPAFFRSIAISLPSPEEHGGIYALRIPTASLYGYTGTAVLPQSGYAVITIDARSQGTISGEIAYPSAFNIKFDLVSGTLNDLDIYRDERHTDGRNGLIGDSFMESMFAYNVYIEHDDKYAYLFARYKKEDNVTTVFESLDGMSLVEIGPDTDWVVVGTVDMTGVTEKTIRLKKTDTVDYGGYSYTLSPVVYKITITKKTLYTAELNPLDKVYDGVAVTPRVSRLYSEDTGNEYTPGEDERYSVEYTFSKATGTAWVETGSEAPKDAGVYRVAVTIKAASYTAMSETAFVISKRAVTVSHIQNSLIYVTAEEHALWTAPHIISDVGNIYLSGVVGSDDVFANLIVSGRAFYNDVSIGYATNKITLEGLTLSGADSSNYEITGTQTVFGQISYSINGAIFRKEPGKSWDKFYPIDSVLPVTPDTSDYHSPENNGVFDTHCEYVYVRTENKKDEHRVYAVDIEYGAMCFTYYRAEWNSEDMVYEDLVGESRWTGFDGNNNRIQIINRSNSEILYLAKCKIDFLHANLGDSTTGIKADFYAENLSTGEPITEIEQSVPAATAGDANAAGTAGTSNCYLILSGVPQLGESNKYTVVGSFTITVSRAGG